MLVHRDRRCLDRDGVRSAGAFVVGSIERYGNRRQQVERLVSAWNRGVAVAVA